MHAVASAKPAEDQVPQTIPYSLPLELTVTDPEVITELNAKQEGRERDEYALGALRLGVLAMVFMRFKPTRIAFFRFSTSRRDRYGIHQEDDRG